MDNILVNTFAAVYSRLLDEFRDQLPLYLSSDAILDWFGNVVSGRENIAHYMLLEVPSTTHVFTSIKQLATTVPQAVTANCSESDASSLSLDLCVLSITNDDHISALSTPMETVSSADIGMAPIKCAKMHSPLCSDMLLMEAVGKLEFYHNKNMEYVQQKSMKVFKDLQRWERACRLQVFYTINSGAVEEIVSHPEFKHFRIHKMVYRESVKCRRNLALEFEQVMQHT